MADAVGCVTKAIDLALKIKDAVDTVRQNRKDCAHIKRRAERVRHTLSLCESNGELMESPAVRDAVEALAEVLGEALDLVAGCQAETNALCVYCTARKLSKQLSKVDRGISDGNAEATFAILVYHISKQTVDAAGPAMPTQGRIYSPMPISAARFYRRGHTLHFQLGIDSYVRPNHDLASTSEDNYEDDGALLQEIARVTLAIRTAMETVRWNKDECIEIAKLASRSSVLLSKLGDKETMTDTAVLGALKRLFITFRHAHELVAACQRRSIAVVCSPGKLSSELRGVLDEMMLGLDDLIDVLAVTTNSSVALET